MKKQPTDELTAAYAESVDREREAWHALQSHAPGSAERARAWQAWSDAILRTNDAWRKLNARRFADPQRRTRQQGDLSHAGA